MQRFKQPNMDLHPDGEWIRYEDHCEAMKRIAAPSASAQQAVKGAWCSKCSAFQCECAAPAPAQQAEPVAWIAEHEDDSKDFVNFYEDVARQQAEDSGALRVRPLTYVDAPAAPAPAQQAPAGDDQKDLYNLCASLVDICDDATNNPPESRTYVDGAYAQTVAELRALLPVPSASPADQDARDAARYRHLRKSAAAKWRNGPGLYWYLPALTPMTAEGLDAAIDAAMSASKEGA